MSRGLGDVYKRQIVYRLAELAIHVGNYDEAMEYYEEFVEMAPNDSLKFVLKYKIYKAKGESLAEQIQILEDLKEQEYIDIFTIVCYMRGIPLDSLHLFMKKDWRRSGNTQRISLQNGRLLHISQMMENRHPCAVTRYSSHSMQLRPAAGNASANGTRYNPAGN